MKRFALTASILATAAFAAPAMAQDVGSVVIGNDGEEVGTVTANDGTSVTLDTGTHEAAVASNTFAQRDGVWTMNATREQVDAVFAGMMEQQQTALAEAMAVGTVVYTADAQELGSITEVTNDGVIVSHMDQPFAIDAARLALDAEGMLVVAANMTDIMAAMGGA